MSSSLLAVGGPAVPENLPSELACVGLGGPLDCGTGLRPDVEVGVPVWGPFPAYELQPAMVLAGLD